MGEKKRRLSATARFVEQYPFCAFCGGVRAATTREHMPPKSLFDDSLRPDKHVMPSCIDCNSGTSTSDLVAALASRWDFYADQESLNDHARLAPRIKKQAPELVNEWQQVNMPSQQRRARKHLQAQGVNVPTGAKLMSIGPLTIRQLNIFAHKVVLGLYFEHFRKPLSDDGRVQAFWQTKEDYAVGGAPQELLSLFTQYNTLTQGRWTVAEDFEYRFDTNTSEGLLGFFARFRRGLFILGFAVENERTLTNNDAGEEVGGIWIRPSKLLGNHPHFLKKNWQ